jgi:hypothetical protein
MLGIPTIYDRVCHKHCSIGWSLSSNRYSMKPTSVDGSMFWGDKFGAREAEKC